MDADDYFWKTKKRPHKTKPRSKSLPKAKEKYLEAEEDFEQALNVLDIKYEKKFQFKSTKHWRFDFHLISVEISDGPWPGGRGGKYENKAWRFERYADEMCRCSFKWRFAVYVYECLSPGHRACAVF